MCHPLLHSLYPLKRVLTLLFGRPVRCSAYGRTFAVCMVTELSYIHVTAIAV